MANKHIPWLELMGTCSSSHVHMHAHMYIIGIIIPYYPAMLYKLHKLTNYKSCSAYLMKPTPPASPSLVFNPSVCRIVSWLSYYYECQVCHDLHTLLCPTHAGIVCVRPTSHAAVRSGRNGWSWSKKWSLKLETRRQQSLMRLLASGGWQAEVNPAQSASEFQPLHIPLNYIPSSNLLFCGY